MYYNIELLKSCIVNFATKNVYEILVIPKELYMICKECNSTDLCKFAKFFGILPPDADAP